MLTEPSRSLVQSDDSCHPMLTSGRPVASIVIAILSCTAISAETLKVATFNIRQEGRQNKTAASSLWEEHHWYYRRPEVVALLRQTDADLIGLQEVFCHILGPQYAIERCYPQGVHVSVQLAEAEFARNEYRLDSCQKCMCIERV